MNSQPRRGPRHGFAGDLPRSGRYDECIVVGIIGMRRGDGTNPGADGRETVALPPATYMLQRKESAMSNRLEFIQRTKTSP